VNSLCFARNNSIVIVEVTLSVRNMWLVLIRGCITMFGTSLPLFFKTHDGIVSGSFVFVATTLLPSLNLILYVVVASPHNNGSTLNRAKDFTYKLNLGARPRHSSFDRINLPLNFNFCLRYRFVFVAVPMLILSVPTRTEAQLLPTHTHAKHILARHLPLRIHPLW